MIRRPPRSTLFPLHDALPIYEHPNGLEHVRQSSLAAGRRHWRRSEEHTSELQSRLHLVCRLLLEKKKKKDRPAQALHDTNFCRPTHNTILLVDNVALRVDSVL